MRNPPDTRREPTPTAAPEHVIIDGLMSSTRSLDGVGLRDVPTERLKTLLRAVYRNETIIPLSPAGVAALGLQDWSENVLGQLRGLDARAIHVVLVAVLAERGTSSAH